VQVLPDPAALITLPLRLAVGALRLGFSLLRGLVEDEREEPAPTPGRVSAPPRRTPPSPRPAAEPRGRPAPERPEPEPPPHVSEEPVLVAETADPGAEDGPGPQLSVGEPWDGYARMRANEVIGRIERATREQLAVVQLYETTHRRRKTVLAAAERRLKVLSPPGRG
jgi:hypothetical protein